MQTQFGAAGGMTGRQAGRGACVCGGGSTQTFNKQWAFCGEWTMKAAYVRGFVLSWITLFHCLFNLLQALDVKEGFLHHFLLNS